VAKLTAWRDFVVAVVAYRVYANCRAWASYL